MSKKYFFSTNQKKILQLQKWNETYLAVILGYETIIWHHQSQNLGFFQVLIRAHCVAKALWLTYDGYTLLCSMFDDGTTVVFSSPLIYYSLSSVAYFQTSKKPSSKGQMYYACLILPLYHFIKVTEIHRFFAL